MKIIVKMERNGTYATLYSYNNLSKFISKFFIIKRMWHGRKIAERGIVPTHT